MTLVEQLRDVVREHIWDKGISQHALSGRTGYSEKHISMLLTGRVDGSFDAWQRIADALGCQWDVDLWNKPGGNR